jgi:hypothetical protein
MNNFELCPKERELLKQFIYSALPCMRAVGGKGMNLAQYESVFIRILNEPTPVPCQLCGKEENVSREQNKVTEQALNVCQFCKSKFLKYKNEPTG